MSRFALCRSESLKEFDVVFKELSDNFDVKEIHTDKCCSDRNILVESFGEDCKIYEDIFHASKRPTTVVGRKVLEKRYQPFCREVANSFRHPNDKAQTTRKMATIGEEEIVKNLERVLHDWPEIPERAKLEIDKLIGHAKKGEYCY